MNEQANHPSRAGYWGALLVTGWALADSLGGWGNLVSDDLRLPPLLFPLLAAGYLMVLVELGTRRAKKAGRVAPRPTWLKSAFTRYLLVLGAVGLARTIVHAHPYFDHPDFAFTRTFYHNAWLLVLLFGLPYMLATVRFRGDVRYDFNDFAIVLLAGVRAAAKGIVAHATGNDRLARRYLRRIRNARVRKLILVYVATLFFLTLMTRFFAAESAAFASAVDTLLVSDFTAQPFIDLYHRVYLVLFHLLLVVDTAVATIAYAISSRWLGNRIRSIDFTLYGWAAALICYPPFNDAMSNFIGYGAFSTTPLVTDDWARVLLMTLILLCMSVYVWATLALGLKFGNLVHRGIVTHGPYRYVRHPAYAAKNISWWLDNTQVLSNPGATLALAAWNVIYWLRGVTEERHLSRDPVYRRYRAETPGRFLPRFVVSGSRHLRRAEEEQPAPKHPDAKG